MRHNLGYTYFKFPKLYFKSFVQVVLSHSYFYFNKNTCHYLFYLKYTYFKYLPKVQCTRNIVKIILRIQITLFVESLFT